MVRISAFQADGPGSIPGQRIVSFLASAKCSSTLFSNMLQVPLAQWLERRSYEPDVAGSNPAWNILSFNLGKVLLLQF